MKLIRTDMWAQSPLYAAGMAVVLSMGAVMVAESFFSPPPVSVAVRAVVGIGEVVGIGLLLLAAWRWHQPRGTQS